MPPLHCLQAVSSLVHNVRQEKNLQFVLRLHAHMRIHGFDIHPSLGRELISILAGIGSSISHAEEVFKRLPYRDTCSWTSLLTGYLACGQLHCALNLYQKMQEEDSLQPNSFAFVKLVQACTELKDLQRGQQLHAEILKQGSLQSNLFIGSALVELYAKCGSLVKVQAVFDELAVRDVVLWTTLIGAYAEQGHGEEALSFFKQMQEEGFSPDIVSFVCGLKACGSIGAPDMGDELHTEIVLMGLERDVIVGNTLVDMYLKCGFLGKAREVFDKLFVRNIVSWNALITGYAEHGYGEEALNCFKQMQHEDISPDDVSFVSSLRACAILHAVDFGRDIHIMAVRQGLEAELFVGNTLVDMYAKCGFVAEARALFNKLLLRDSVSWNALLSGYTEHGRGKEALECFAQMQRESLSPHVAMFLCGLKACGIVGEGENGKELHTEICARGLEGDLMVGNTLIDMYTKCDWLEEAEYVFDKLQIRSDVTWNTLIAGYWEHGYGEEALDCYEEMQDSGTNPSSPTVVCSLKACGSVCATLKGQEIHTQATLQGMDDELFVGNTLVDMYVKCCCLREAEVVFDKLPVRDRVSWNAVLTGYAQVGESRKVFGIFYKMIDEGIKPDFFTFVNLLNACSHAGILEEGQMYFHAMGKEFGIISTPEHHSCMVNLLGRAGLVREAVAIMNEMPCHPGVIAWHTILGACQKWGNVELGRDAFEHAVQVDETDTTAYFCMSNIYANRRLEKGDYVMENHKLECKHELAEASVMSLMFCAPVIWQR